MENNNILGTEKTGKLLLQFTIPSIIAMVVSSLYNIVDQFFIGRSIGVLGNAATNVAFPLTITYVAISLLCGIGGAANFNLSMGRKDYKNAEAYVGGAVGMMVILGIALCTVVQIFLHPLMLAFGATDKVLNYAMTYTRITAFGLPFVILTTGGSHLVRADGSPKYSMLCTLSGAFINLILDPIFIFGFDMGMAGAAYATVIGQIVSTALILRYFMHFKTIHLHLHSVIPSCHAWKSIASLGIAPFFNQLSLMIVQIILNNSLTYYGAMSVFGEDIPLACAGIISKVNMVFFSIIIGISQGMQPIISYNYGAENYDRVKETYKKAITAALIISSFAFLLFQIFPRRIIGLFGSGSEEYYMFAEEFFRVYLFFIFLNGFQPLTANTFTAIGQARKGVFISLTRQIIFLLPLLIILPIFLGIDGIMLSSPIADLISAITSIVLIKKEFARMQ